MQESGNIFDYEDEDYLGQHLSELQHSRCDRSLPSTGSAAHNYFIKNSPRLLPPKKLPSRTYRTSDKIHPRVFKYGLETGSPCSSILSDNISTGSSKKIKKTYYPSGKVNVRYVGRLKECSEPALKSQRLRYSKLKFCEDWLKMSTLESGEAKFSLCGGGSKKESGRGLSAFQETSCEALMNSRKISKNTLSNASKKTSVIFIANSSCLYDSSIVFSDNAPTSHLIRSTRFNLHCSQAAETFDPISPINANRSVEGDCSSASSLGLSDLQSSPPHNWSKSLLKDSTTAQQRRRDHHHHNKRIHGSPSRLAELEAELARLRHQIAALVIAQESGMPITNILRVTDNPIEGEQQEHGLSRELVSTRIPATLVIASEK
ncbi:unnamed protein product [Protopolystoma xenopodis]|uniref:Uncharacterized protein n=1 Tax=Protopolystoma xenopodis TaxID=117903 RepID=A0A3S5FCT8_9PLAT|nr:unnamed protein product [Protopolystoma xenopodis]